MMIKYTKKKDTNGMTKKTPFHLHSKEQKSLKNLTIIYAVWIIRYGWWNRSKFLQFVYEIRTTNKAKRQIIQTDVMNAF